MGSEKDRGFFVRPVRVSDLDSIFEIAGQIGPGFTSLPQDQQTIDKKIQRSISSFSEKEPLENRIFFFVLEQEDTKKIIGTAAIEARAGHENPFYTLEIIPMIQTSTALKLQYEYKMLFLNNALQNASMLSTLYVSNESRGKGEGSFLSRSRFLFIAEFQSFFADHIIASMRGFFDQDQHSPFWRGLGKKFFNSDFKKMDFLVATQGSTMISDLYPHFPIYVNLLSEEAKQVIGKVHPNTEPALHVLKKEGFQFKNNIDVFDGGPIIECAKENIKTLGISKRFKVDKIQNLSEQKEYSTVMISHLIPEFRATLGKVDFLDQETVIVEENAAKRLNIEVGQSIRIAEFKQGLQRKVL